MYITEFQRRALLALMDVEAARVADGRTGRRTAHHRLFALMRERYGCKYSCLPRRKFRDAALWLLDEPLTDGGRV
ncbi:hypothetical protein [uncultured Bilophila sp.]|uniref:hypothetical protein n=1 Tax=uncultured Bilophila sp. TaxID=529385 RepID=UPI0026704A07|nr:hypothetical protein [uncultured Bilophila sp.]